MTLHLQEKFNRIYQNNSVKNYSKIIGYIGVDKQGKGTTWRHTLYALSELGYNVLGIPFPSYDHLGGLGVELLLSASSFKKDPELKKVFYKHKINPEEFVKTSAQIATAYPFDRSRSVDIIKTFQEQGYIIVTKRSSKATHAAYQAGLNGLDEQVIMGLDGLHPDPQILINLTAKENTPLTKDFKHKGSIVLDENECRPQDKVVMLQEKYTSKPELVGSKYGVFIPGVEAPQRLENILLKLKRIFQEENHLYKKSSSQKGSLIIHGLEEPKYQFREPESLDEFLTEFSGKDVIKSLFTSHVEHFDALNKKETYEKLFSNPFSGEKDPYPFSVEENINSIIKKFK